MIEVVLLMTHRLDGAILAGFRRLVEEAGRTVVLLYNRGDDPRPGPWWPAGSFVFDAADIRGLGFPAKGRRRSAWDVELFPLLYRRHHPEVDRVWVVEYDVAFTGRWHTLFDAFAASPADLLATTIHSHAANPGWDNWRTVSAPDGPVERRDLLRAFLPCCRLSAAAFAALETAYAAGWDGHYEATVPTLIARAGLSIEDIGGNGPFVAPGNENRFYTNTPAANSLAPGSFVFRPVREQPGPEPDRLWHPVKPPSVSEGWATGRRAALVRLAAATLERLRDKVSP
ncbi:MAG: hypothetical protein HY985_17060 [Magnetospirillum sp.]|nr:hypothetical protein [Magnetospirillum sp.]